ncbi:DUF4129 domain-containing protein [Polymorphospora rubra]|uniref:Protein-glutamine gamma-glutamyltransferase-like C-terminal domain-containing protein n=1 Tax=Polymorphospora rubra TaxID=338584 RepID=A0A810MXH5_9ACTN|nr:DUF4129 domain-containing protein [Polymorphospora rubra]BCJ64313.1 hypothetical protein Prubr_13340 [Polymorphospora rubra]
MSTTTRAGQVSPVGAVDFSRWWTEKVASVGDALPLPLAALLLVAAAALVAAGWYWWPAWVPRRLPGLPRWRWRGWRWKLRRPRWPWRRDRKRPAGVDVPGEAAPDDLPALPAAAFVSLADRYAAQGRYAEAVRERLRAVIRELTDRQVIEHRPGWTITELAGAAGSARPAVDAPLAAAGRLFSDLWYGQRPARPEHDARMRQLAGEVLRAVDAGRPPSVVGAAGEDDR